MQILTYLGLEHKLHPPAPEEVLRAAVLVSVLRLETAHSSVCSLSAAFTVSKQIRWYKQEYLSLI